MTELGEPKATPDGATECDPAAQSAFSGLDCRDPAQAREARALLAESLLAKGWPRRRARRAARDFVRMRRQEGPNEPHKLGSSQVEVIAALRAMTLPAGADPLADEDDARRERNRRKAARRRRR